MAHHASAKKRIRQNEAHRLHNRYYAVTMRNAVRKLRACDNKEEAEKSLPTVSKMIDKLAKRNIIHKNKAANLKSKLAKHVNNIGKAA
ncbi:MAG: 30S ribosomal protein S20 [Bacteroidales bacterium]|nr:30S ribosomal protein S20 [Bacteroidales bacterium]